MTNPNTDPLLREVDELIAELDHGEDAVSVAEGWHSYNNYFCATAPRLLRALRDRLVEIEAERDWLKNAIVQWDGGLVNTPRAARTTDYVLRVFHAEQQAAAEAREAMSETLEAAEDRITALEQALAVIQAAAHGDEKSECWTGLSESLDLLRGMVAAIRNRSPLRLSSEIELLIQQAAHAHGTPDDIAAWARRLAEDVRDLPDAAEGRQGLVDNLSLTLDEARLLCHLLGRARTPRPTEDR